MERYQTKIAQARLRGLKCTCWDHLREFGITPPAALAERHRDYAGKIHLVNDGEVDTQRTRSMNTGQSEAEAVMKKGRGQNA